DGMNADTRRAAGGRIWGAVATGTREAVGLLVDDGAVALGIILAVAAAALLAWLGMGDVIGWVLFILVWAALAISLGRIRRER
ncbi:MAG TPA: hypothetical protein VHH34_23500, partial [Pseudonocardiaceae bacterium]|nr:hypothetical protein [Pseudonocardiaceae bacterium]